MGEDRGTLVRTSGASVEYLIQRVWATDLKNATMVHFTAPKRMLSKSAAMSLACGSWPSSRWSSATRA